MRNGWLWWNQEEELGLEPRSSEPQEEDFSSVDAILAIGDEMNAK